MRPRVQSVQIGLVGYIAMRRRRRSGRRKRLRMRGTIPSKQAGASAAGQALQQMHQARAATEETAEDPHALDLLEDDGSDAEIEDEANDEDLEEEDDTFGGLPQNQFSPAEPGKEPEVVVVMGECDTLRTVPYTDIFSAASSSYKFWTAHAGSGSGSKLVFAAPSEDVVMIRSGKNTQFCFKVFDDEKDGFVTVWVQVALKPADSQPSPSGVHVDNGLAMPLYSTFSLSACEPPSTRRTDHHTGNGWSRGRDTLCSAVMLAGPEKRAPSHAESVLQAPGALWHF
ncbi:unnamed protein product [Rangifer tarandus platyrhynchus]|uniref:Uncharacterized protein n=1 Tax=Rangifer tarandus platyrhynchus TaxID=3082113 RepID=A0ABN8XKX3_RANTA|nr:unnamed protein product [Rangifer tarandus platyrhynchus]